MPPHAWIADLDHGDVPADVFARAQDLLLDTLGVAIGAGRVPTAHMAADMAARHFAAGSAELRVRIPFDGRAVSIPGAAYALATRIDSLDAHDGHQPAKGHAGVAVTAAALAFGQTAGAVTDGRQALAALIAGYEIACRAGVTLHATAADYHGSGAWNALGAATLGCRLLGITDKPTIRRALGMAEYHAPRASLMREIDQPSMLHDGSDWGALAGASACLLANDGFRASPAALPAHPDARSLWADLGDRWLVREQYVKPWSVCFWAQPAVRAALELRAAHGIDPGTIARVRVETFHEATRLTMEMPATAEVAQYALAFPVACALQRGRLGPDEIAGGLTDARTRALTERVEAREHADFSERFPAQRLARVTITLDNGTVLASEDTQPYGIPDDPLERDAIVDKFHRYTDGLIDAGRRRAIVSAVMALHEPGRDFGELLGHCMEPANQ